MGLHERFMRRALALARRGEGRVEPNPMVGAVLVRGGRIIAEGWHEAWGGTHAEVVAIRKAAPAGRPGDPGGSPLRGATLYVTLDPCTHFGKTPPCAPFVIESGVRRVVIATRDPNPINTGRGVALLRRAGVEVIEGVLRREAENLNAPFFKLHRTGRPWVIAKWAMSADGRIATRSGDSKWITDPEARAFARRLRTRCRAVVIGIGTALKDDPGLMPEPLSGRDPSSRLRASGGPAPPPRPYARVVLDSLARLPIRSKLVRTARRAPVLAAVSARAPARRVGALERAGCEVLVAGRSQPEIGRVLAALGRRGFSHVLVEGGGEVLGSAFDARAVDEVCAFIAPRVIGGTGAVSVVGGIGAGLMAGARGLCQVEWIPLGNDLLLRGRLER